MKFGKLDIGGIMMGIENTVSTEQIEGKFGSEAQCNIILSLSKVPSFIPTCGEGKIGREVVITESALRDY